MRKRREAFFILGLLWINEELVRSEKVGVSVSG